MADLLTTNQVQALLQVDRTTIYRMVEQGRLPAIRVGKQWRFSRPEIERWLQTRTAQLAPTPTQSPQPEPTSTPALSAPKNTTFAPPNPPLRTLLPPACSQLIQDGFAEILGVMLVITDLDGQPLTQVSNPCAFFSALTQSPDAISHCVRTWQQLAVSPTLEPRFSQSEMGLLCARGLIRVGSELKGMVVIGGIAPDRWPPEPRLLTGLATTFGLEQAYVEANVNAVYRLDKATQEKVLRSVQRIADIFSHIAEDRNALCGRLQAIAALTVF
ncbi:MAG: PocR ligand-binding domain-containing protein [Caldilineaceae bacterium]